MKLKVGDIVKVKGGTPRVWKILIINGVNVLLYTSERSYWDYLENLVKVK